MLAAVRTAIELQRRLADLNRSWIAKGESPWQQVVVLSYGWVVSGNIGCTSRMDYTVIGDAVNTASRLEAIAKQCGQGIVMSAAVAEHHCTALLTLAHFQYAARATTSVRTTN